MSTAKKVRLTVDVPVQPRHGMKKDSIRDVVRQVGRAVWVMGDDGDLVKLWPQEYEFVDQKKKETM